ncbi:MAG: very short patch repair endonuclease [Desulfuromonadales bacterium]|nr:very short patch repair endonuclease [Desulfuromonadales bacterium]
MDVFSKEQRSRNMSRVGGKNTKPELAVRSVLHQLGYRFRLHRVDLPGKPDITLPKHRKIIFVHGCFWHSHQGCSRSQRPTTNESFWRDKLDKNIARDRSNIRALQQAGWDVLIVWGCETKDTEMLRGKLLSFLQTTTLRENGR